MTREYNGFKKLTGYLCVVILALMVMCAQYDVLANVVPLPSVSSIPSPTPGSLQPIQPTPSPGATEKPNEPPQVQLPSDTPEASVTPDVTGLITPEPIDSETPAVTQTIEPTATVFPQELAVTPTPTKVIQEQSSIVSRLFGFLSEIEWLWVAVGSVATLLVVVIVILVVRHTTKRPDKHSRNAPVAIKKPNSEAEITLRPPKREEDALSRRIAYRKVDRALLLLMESTGETVQMRLEYMEPLIIGSDPQKSNLVLPHPGILPQHCKLVCFENSVFVVDLCGQTRINGHDMFLPEQLTETDVIEIGNMRIHVSWE